MEREIHGICGFHVVIALLMLPLRSLLLFIEVYRNQFQSFHVFLTLYVCEEYGILPLRIYQNLDLRFMSQRRS